MKFILLVLPLITFAATYWSPVSAIKQGFNVTHECKDNIQIVIFTKGKQIFEQPYCYDQGSWDKDCLHAPIKCYKKEKK